jgi:uncharacterized protein YbaR (Trm112 family)
MTCMGALKAGIDATTVEIAGTLITRTHSRAYPIKRNHWKML